MLTPGLARALQGRGGDDAYLRSLVRSLACETALAMLVLAAVAFLGVQSPPNA